MTADYQATDKLNLNGGLLYSDAQSQWKNLNLTAPSVIDDPSVFALYTFDIGHMTRYSDLRFKQAELSLGGKYQFTPALYMTASAGVQGFIDEDPYVYGDMDGTAYRGSMGVGYKF